mgnify:CR=1 FL=1
MHRDDRGQSIVFVALFLLFVGLLFLVSMGVAVAYAQLARTQAAADAGALAGARQALVREIKVGGNSICRLAEIDPATAGQKAREVWNLNLGGTPIQTVAFNTTVYPNTRPTRFRLYAEVESPISPLAIIGKPRIRWPVAAEAELEQDCRNTLTGPVFTLPRPLPTGWPVPGAEWVWNFPMADRNAPTGWPVYFVKTFDLAVADTVYVYAAADADYEIGIDDQRVLTGSGAGIRSASVTLSDGPHMIWIRATNPEPPTPFTGPNPAGIVVGIRDGQYNVVAATKGNPLANAGRPDAEDDWSSWSPPNPDWSVFLDPFYPTSYLSGATGLATALESLGFSLRTATDLAAWMQSSINNARAARTLVVMAQDVVPDTVAASPSSSALIRQYLDAGGSVLWMGAVPFYYQGRPDGSKILWGQDAQQQILGVPNPSTYWLSAPGAPVQTLPAGAGYGIGVSPWWQSPASTRALAPYCWAQPLAQISSGGIAVWRVPYWPLRPDCNEGSQYIHDARREDSPGFVRIFDSPVDASDSRYLVSVLTVAGQLAGWYRGQVP